MARFIISLITITLLCAPLGNAEIDPGSIVGAWLFDETGLITFMEKSPKIHLTTGMMGTSRVVRNGQRVNLATPLNLTVRTLG